MTATASQSSTAKSREGAALVEVWDFPLRLFHWLLVLTVAIAFISSEEDSPLNQWHILAGWVAGLLILFRLIWGFAGGEHSRFLDFVRPSRIGEHVRLILRREAEPTIGHNPLGGISVLIILALVAATVSTGAFGGEAMEGVHELIAWSLLAFIGVHVAAVLIMSVLQRENLVSAMITGKKRADRHKGATNATHPSPIGILLTLLVLASSIYGILKYDPHAFTLRSAESFQEGAGAAGGLVQSHRGDRGD